MKLKTKFLIIFLLLSNIPILVITLFTYDRYTKLVDQQTTQVYTNVFDKAVEEANSTISNINSIAEIFQFYSQTDDSIVDELKKYIDPEYVFNYYDIFSSNNNIKFICQNLIYSSEYINGIFVLTPSGVNLGYGYGGNIDIKYGYLPFEDKWYQDTLSLEGKTLVTGITTKEFIYNAKPSISFSKALYDVYSREFLGILLIDCSPDVFDLSNINTLPETTMLSIENSDNYILYSNIDDIKSNFTANNTKVKKTTLDIDSLTLVAATNYEQLYKEFGFTRTIIIIIALVCALVFFVISIFLSYYLTKPITYLSKKIANHNMKAMLTSEKYINRTDEIGILYNEYNLMLKELDQFIKKEYENKLITLDSQMKALEAQINSHFLYNTLESINSIAEIEEIESISTMSLALGNMFRYSIKTKSELVTIGEELNHVKDYISIQTIRFDNRFNLVVNIDDNLLEYKILKLILQPIVENALYHGLQYCNYGNTIEINGYIKKSNICLDITDNGIGISEEQLHNLQNKLAEKPHFAELGQRNAQSIGLKNIHSRIELYYGQEYGLTIHSKKKEGTVINIKLPILYYQKKEK